MKLSSPVSAVRFLVLVVLISALSETFVLILILSLPWHMSRLGEAVLDASILAFISAPLLYWLAIKPYERALVAEAEKFRYLLDSAPDGIMGVAPDGRIRFANACALTMFGYARTEMVGHPIHNLILERSDEDDPNEGMSLLPSFGPQALESDSELFGRRKDGTEFPVAVSSNKLKTEEGEISLTTVRDITPRV